jgi:tyrosyl-tRNA synthetase
LIVACGFCKSNNEARQKIKEGAFIYGPDRLRPSDEKALLSIQSGLVVRLGRKIARLQVT